MRRHPFEEEPEIARLAWMPLDVRRKLDLAGLHVSLASWQALSIEEREAWCDAEVSTAGEASAFADRARAACAAHPPREDAPVPADAKPWDSAHAAALVSQRARELELVTDLSGWAGLDESARYALLRLSEKRKSADKLRRALASLGLLR